MLESIPFISNLINWLHARNNEKRAIPVVSIRGFWKDANPPGVRMFVIDISTDATIIDVTGSYSLTTNYGYEKAKTPFSYPPINAGAHEPIDVFRLKIHTPDPVINEELVLNVPVAISYADKIGGKHQATYEISMKVGSVTIQVITKK